MRRFTEGKFLRATGSVLMTILLTAFQLTPAVWAQSATAADMRLSSTEGSVSVQSESGKELSVSDNMRLYSGNHIVTGDDGTAYFSLDDTKAAKLDIVSEAEVRKSGRVQEILVSSGHLFFNVTKPLDGDENLNIRTSSMVTGVRGTAGYVEIIDRNENILSLLEGVLEIRVTDPVNGQVRTVTLHAGETARILIHVDEHGVRSAEIKISKLTEEDIPGCVAMAIKGNPALQEKIRNQTDLDVDRIVREAEQKLDEERGKIQNDLKKIADAVKNLDGNVAVDPVFGNKNQDSSDSGSTVLPDSITVSLPLTSSQLNSYLSQYQTVNVNSGTTNAFTAGDDADVSIPTGKTVNFASGTATTVAAGRTLTVDGTFNNNGTLTNNGTVNSAGTHTLNVAGETINNAVFTNTGVFHAGSFTQSGGTLTNSGTMTVSGVTAISAGTLNNEAAGTLTLSGTTSLTGGTLRSNGTAALGTVNLSGSGVFAMEGGTLTFNSSLVMTGGTATLSGGSCSGAGIQANGGTLTMSGGTFTGSASLITAGGTASVNITGGTLSETGTEAALISEFTDAAGGGSLTLNSSAVVQAASADGLVSGLVNYVSGTGTTATVTLPGAFTTVTGSGPYTLSGFSETLAEAVAAAAEGSTVVNTSGADVTASEALVPAHSITLDMQNNQLVSTSDPVIQMSGTTLEILNCGNLINTAGAANISFTAADGQVIFDHSGGDVQFLASAGIDLATCSVTLRNQSQVILSKLGSRIGSLSMSDDSSLQGTLQIVGGIVTLNQGTFNGTMILNHGTRLIMNEGAVISYQGEAGADYTSAMVITGDGITLELNGGTIENTINDIGYDAISFLDAETASSVLPRSSFQTKIRSVIGTVTNLDSALPSGYSIVGPTDNFYYLQYQNSSGLSGLALSASGSDAAEDDASPSNASGSDAESSLTDGQILRNLLFGRKSGKRTAADAGLKTDGEASAAAETVSTETGLVSILNAFTSPSSVVLGTDGSLYVTDVFNKVINRIADGVSSVFAGKKTVADTSGQPVGGYNDAKKEDAYFAEPWAICPFLNGYAVSDSANHVVRLITETQVRTLVGNGRAGSADGYGIAATFNRPTGLAADNAGNLYIADTGNGLIRKLTTGGTVTTVARGLNEPTGLCWKNGILYCAESGSNRIIKLVGGKPEVLAGRSEGFLDGAVGNAAFSAPQGVAVDEDGTVYVADTGNRAIRKITGGNVSTLLVNAGTELQNFPVSPRSILITENMLYICDPYAGRLVQTEKN